MGEERIYSGFDSIGGVCDHSLSELVIADFYAEFFKKKSADSGQLDGRKELETFASAS